MEEELSLFEEQRRFNEQSIAEQQILADEEIKILDEKLRLKKISETAYQTEKLKIENDLKEAQNEADKKELENIQEFEDKKAELLENIRLKKAEDDAEREQIELELQFEKDKAEIEKLIEDETQRTELLALLTEERELVLQEIKQRFKEENLEIFKKALQEENKAQKTAGDAQIAIARSVAQSLTGVLGDSLAARLAGIAVDAALQISQVKTTAAAAQARNLALATASAPPPLNVPFIGAALTQNAGIAANAGIQTANILKASALSGFKSSISSLKLEKGGIVGIGGKRHSQGGTKFYGEDGTTFEAEQGEGIGVLNRGAYASFMDFNNRFGSGQSSNGFFQGGGIITQGVKTDTQNLDSIAEAIANQPQPVVAVEEIQRVGSEFISVKNMANL